MKARQLSLVILVAGLALALKWAVAAQGPEEQRPIIARVQVDDLYSSGGTFIVDHTRIAALSQPAFIDVQDAGRTHTLPNHTILINTAWIDADRIAPASATQETTVTSRPVLTITKTGFPDTVEPNGILRYTIIITNSGNENATPVTITEHYDSYVSFFFSDPPPSDAGTGNRTWVFPSLDADESETINIFALADSVIPMGTILTNQATLESGQTAPMTATETTSVSSAAEFTFLKYDLSDPVEAGALLDYVIHYDNHGDSPAYDVVVTETYDSRVTFVSAVPAPSEGDNVWNIGPLAVGTFGDIMVTVHVTTPLPNNGTLTNHATIRGTGTFAKSYTETTTVSSAPDLTFIVTDTPDPVEAGAPLTYTLRYTNAGNADATGVVITATFDSNVSLSNSDATPPPDGGSGRIRYWNLESIPGEGGFGDGGSGDIVIRTNVTLPLTDSTKLNFTAQLADAEGDFLERTAGTTVNSASALSLLKSDGVSYVEAGDRLTYTLTYANSGNENAYHVTITDTLPTYVEYIDCDGCQPPGGPDPDTVVFHISAITQTSGQVQLFVQVQDPLSAGADFMTNTARMTHRSLPNPIDVVDIDRIDTKADLTIAANHTPSLFSPGRLMTYTVTYGNEGEHVDASHVMITTTLPDGTDYVADPVGNGWHSSDGQTYTYTVGALPAGSTGHKITFTVRHTDTPQISAPEYVTPFTIAEDGGAIGDANPEDNVADVTISVPDLTVVDFTVEPVDPLPPNVPVTFTVVLKNQGTGWAWNPDTSGGCYVDIFADYVPSYPWVRNSDIVYTTADVLAPGAQVTLILTHPGFSEEQIREQIQAFYVKVDNYAAPIYDHGHIIGWTRLWGLVPEYDEMNNVAYVAPLTAQFIATPTTGCVPLTVNFADQSTGNRTSWSWDFGDGVTSTLQSPTHTYTAVGAYTITLTVSGLGGTDTLTRVNYITVYDSGSIIYLPLMMRRWPPLPDTPVLNPISNPDGNGNYTVRWGAADLADTYVLQEDDNSSFSSPVRRYSGSGTSWYASGKAVGTYYYRVIAKNSWGSSDWSNVESVSVQPPGKLYSVGDAFIIQGYPTVNAGDTIDMWAGYDDLLDPDGKIVRSLIKFDLSAIPAGASISSASLHVRVYDSWDYPGKSRTITTYRITSSWSESSVTWNKSPSIGAAYGSANVSHDDSGKWCAFDVTNLVRGWVNGGYANYGVMLRGPEWSGSDSSWKAFYTRESSSSDPYLQITYAGVAGSGEGPTSKGALGSQGEHPMVIELLGDDLLSAHLCQDHVGEGQRCLALPLLPK